MREELEIVMSIFVLISKAMYIYYFDIFEGVSARRDATTNICQVLWVGWVL